MPSEGASPVSAQASIAVSDGRVKQNFAGNSSPAFRDGPGYLAARKQQHIVSKNKDQAWR